MPKSYFLFLILLLNACTKDPFPKPKGFLNLEYEKEKYTELSLDRPYVFAVSQNAVIRDEPKQWLKIEYPKLKASIDLTYRKVDKNLRELLVESEKLVFKHTVKAEQISSNDYTNEARKVYGTLYEITGNAASQIQFHITDSTDNFIKGALFFKIKPNYDSVLPAVAHIKKDILHMMETFEWKH